MTGIYQDDTEVTAARPGENLKLRVTGVEEDEVSPGFVLCSVQNPVPQVTYFDVQASELGGEGGAMRFGCQGLMRCWPVRMQIARIKHRWPPSLHALSTGCPSIGFRSGAPNLSPLVCPCTPDPSGRAAGAQAHPVGRVQGHPPCALRQASDQGKEVRVSRRPATH